MPKNPEPKTQIFAGPPRRWPTSDIAMSRKNSPPPERMSISPIQMNMITTVAPTTMGEPNTALGSSAR